MGIERWKWAGSRAREAASGQDARVRHGLPIAAVGMLLCLAGCGSEPAPVAERAPPPDADERRLVREFNALDTLMSQLQGTSNFLNQQLSRLPGWTTPSKS